MKSNFSKNQIIVLMDELIQAEAANKKNFLWIF